MNACKCEEIAEEGKSRVEKSLAMELLSEQVKNSRRWFSAFLIVLVMWFATIGGFIWFLNQYNSETYEQDGAKRALNEFSATGNINTMASVQNAVNGAENAPESELGDIRPALNRYNAEKSLENFERLCVEIEEFCKAVYAEIDSEEKNNFFKKTLTKSFSRDIIIMW